MKLVHLIHQTRLSSYLRRIPIFKYLFVAAWRHTQSIQFRKKVSSLRNILAQSSTTVNAESSVGSDTIPSLDQIINKDSAIIERGKSFSDEMAKFCDTAKFYAMGYELIYGTILTELKDKFVNILEIGIGVNDPNSKSGMLCDHLPGSSLIGWAHFFSNSNVHGADIDARVVKDTNFYKAHFVDQRSFRSVIELSKQFSGLDLVVDDGLHTPEANANILCAFLPLIKQNGFLVIEDILEEFDFLWLELEKQGIEGFQVRFFPGRYLSSSRQGLALFRRNY